MNRNSHFAAVSAAMSANERSLVQFGQVDVAEAILAATGDLGL